MTEAPAMQFDDLDQQREAAGLGMWTFLATEVLLFGGLFTAYTVCRVSYPAAFADASHHLYQWIGVTNTAVLLVSSLTMALAVRAAGIEARRSLTLFLGLTILLGLTFLGLKGYEYYLDWHDQLVPVANFDPSLFADPRHAKLFFVAYFVMTGLHAFHMACGVGAAAVMLALARRGRFTRANHNPVEVTGLYWHLVDIIWVFLLPLLYLLR